MFSTIDCACALIPSMADILAISLYANTFCSFLLPILFKNLNKMFRNTKKGFIFYRTHFIQCEQAKRLFWLLQWKNEPDFFPYIFMKNVKKNWKESYTRWNGFNISVAKCCTNNESAAAAETTQTTPFLLYARNWLWIRAYRIFIRTSGVLRTYFLQYVSS